jgi:hypothetical protein
MAGYFGFLIYPKSWKLTGKFFLSKANLVSESQICRLSDSTVAKLNSEIGFGKMQEASCFRSELGMLQIKNINELLKDLLINSFL